MRPLNNFKQDFKGKKVLVMGLGLLGRGLADARFLAEIGAKVTVTDLKKEEELRPSLKSLKGLPIKFVLGKHRENDFKNCDFLIRNPAVPQSSHYLNIAEKAGAKIFMDEALFALYAPVKIIGVTGTRGKTTTTTLIYQIIKKAGLRVYLAGNILGLATLPLLRKVRKGDWVVMELSSWQLQGFAKIKKSPHIGVITSIFPDHLNRYSSMEKYIDDKKAIFRFQEKSDYLILNQNQKITRELGKEALVSKLVGFRLTDIPKNWQLKIIGQHNQLNAAAASRVAQVLGIGKSIVKKVIEEFPGVEYRLEIKRKLKGVTFVNDTTSTTPAALEVGLQAFDRPIVLIAGGASKNLPLEKVAKTTVRKAKKIILLKGSGTEKFKKMIKKFGGRGQIVGLFDNLKQAVVIAFSQAKPGEIVLFSPGFASFGMFKNEFDRGKQFNRAVEQLDHETK